MAILIPLLKTAVSAVASTATATGISALSGGTTSTKEQANYQNDIVVNSGHAKNYFDQFWLEKVTDSFRLYVKQGFIKESDYNDLANFWNTEVFPAVEKDPYLGGIGGSYTSKYTGFTFATVPAVGIAQMVDSWLDQRLGTQAVTQTPTGQQNDIMNILQSKLESALPEFLDYWTKKAVSEIQGNQTTDIPETRTSLNFTPVILGVVAVVVVFLLMRRK